MRAILTPDVAPRTGTVILRPGNDLLCMFRGRVVVSMEPEYLKSVPSGRLHDSEQPLLDDPRSPLMLKVVNDYGVINNVNINRSE